MITEKQVNDFKVNYCDENKIIPIILKEKFADLVEDPILDIGSGLGEISSYAFPNRDVLHLDIEDFSMHNIDLKHAREINDFFLFETKGKKYKTILLSHTLQFIDDDIDKLNKKINHLDVDKLILIRNTNDDFMADILNYFDSRNILSNPERIIYGFPKGYTEIKKESFVALLKCPDFNILADQISYLWDLSFSEEIKKDFILFLKEKLTSSEFKIHQEIVLYQK